LRAVSPHESAEAVAGSWRAGSDWLLVQESLDVGSKSRSRFVSSVSLLRQRFHDDPVQVPAHKTAELARLRLA
jgi:hypothetical protein